jgi:hypothetical protein
MKKYRYVFFVLFMFNSVFLIAQNEKEKAIYDSITYHYYQNSVWDSVIDIGKEAVYKGYDFYFLRMRMGIAYEVQSNYRMAEKQFAQALDFKPNDAIAASNLYHAAVNGGRQHVAYKRYMSFTKEQKTLVLGEDSSFDSIKLPVNFKTLEQVSFYIGQSFTNNNSNAETILPSYESVLYSQSNIRNNQFSGNISLMGNISENFSWNIAYNYLQINGNYLLRNQLDDLIIEEEKTQQNAFFGKLIFWSGNGLSVEAYTHLLSYNSDTYNTELVSYSYLPPVINDTVFSVIPNLETKNETKSNTDWIAGIKINKSIGLLDLAVFANYAQIFESNPLQLGGEITILPNGNYHLYLTQRITYYTDDTSDRFIYKVIAGGHLIKRLQFLAATTFGDIQQTNEAAYAISYNWSEKTTYKADVGLRYPLSEKVLLSLHYQFIQKKNETDFQQFNGYMENSEAVFVPTFKKVVDEYDFFEHFVFLGLMWSL